MTVYKAITTARDMVPSEVAPGTMVLWLSALDGQLWHDIVHQYEDTEPETMPSYTDTDNTQDAGTELMVAAPHDLMYVSYLLMRIHLHNADYERYNNAAAMFNEQQKTWANWYNREHVHSKRVTRPDEGRWATWLRF